MKITVGRLRKLIREAMERKPQKGDTILVGDDFSDEYTEDRIIEVTPTGVYVSGMDLEIAFSDMAWNEQKNAWVDDIAYDIIEMETPLDASLSELDNKMLRLMSNAATSTTGIKDVPNFQIRPMKNGIRYVEDEINIEGTMSASEIKNFTGLDVAAAADWMFQHGARKMKRQKRRPRSFSIYD